jgi:hypothetical protein
MVKGINLGGNGINLHAFSTVNYMCCKLFRDLMILGLVPVCHLLYICSLEQECTNFPKIWELSQNSRHQKGDINYAPC